MVNLTNLAKTNLPPDVGFLAPGAVLISERERAPFMSYFKNTWGGGIELDGAEQLVLATNLTVQAILDLSEANITALLASTNTASTKTDINAKDTRDPIATPGRQTADRVRALFGPGKDAPTVQQTEPQFGVPMQGYRRSFGLLLKNRPSNVLVCKAYQRVFVIEIVSVDEKGNSLTIRRHERK